MTERVAIYARTSTLDQREKNTEQNQLYDIQSWLSELPVSYSESDVYVDVGRSGADATREAYNRMINNISNYDAVVVWDVDRLARDFGIGIAFIQLLRDNGKRCYVWRSRKVYDYSNIGDLMQHVIYVMMADEERKKIEERRLSGMARYRREHGLKEDEWVHRPRKRVDWQQYDRMREAGVSIAGIARYLKMHPQTLYSRVKEREQNVKP